MTAPQDAPVAALEPCPFCGVLLIHDAKIRLIEHPDGNCPAAAFGFADDRADVAATWNRRTPSGIEQAVRDARADMREEAAKVAETLAPDRYRVSRDAGNACGIVAFHIRALPLEPEAKTDG